MPENGAGRVPSNSSSNGTHAAGSAHSSNGSDERGCAVPNVMNGDVADLTSQLRRGVAKYLIGRRVDIMGAVDCMLLIASRMPELHCSATGDRIRFQSLNCGLLVEEPLDGARGKVRMLCARMAAIANQLSDRPISPYGDSTKFDYKLNSERDSVVELSFENSAGRQEIRLVVKPHKLDSTAV